jgi:hypothetical protein
MQCTKAITARARLEGLESHQKEVKFRDECWIEQPGLRCMRLSCAFPELELPATSRNGRICGVNPESVGEMTLD